jgi:hypothetical protein
LGVDEWEQVGGARPARADVVENACDLVHASEHIPPGGRGQPAAVELRREKANPARANRPSNL